MVAVCAFAPLLVFAIGKYAFVVLRVCDLGFAYTPMVHGDGLSHANIILNAQEAAARYTWLSSVMVMITVCLLCVTYFLIRFQVHKTPERSVWTWRTAIAALAVFGGLQFIFMPKKNYVCLADELFTNTIGSIPFMGEPLRESLVLITSTTELIAALAAVAISLGAALLLWGRDDGEHEVVDSLAEKFAVLRNYLYLGALLLVTGLMALRYFFFWPQAFISSNMQSAYAEQVNAMLTYQGAVYVLMLAVLFGIPHSILAHRARQLAANSVAGEEGFTAHRQWLEDKKLNAKVSDQLTQMIAILSPLLAGPFGSVLQTVMS